MLVRSLGMMRRPLRRPLLLHLVHMRRKLLLPLPLLMLLLSDCRPQQPLLLLLHHRVLLLYLLSSLLPRRLLLCLSCWLPRQLPRKLPPPDLLLLLMQLLHCRLSRCQQPIVQKAPHALAAHERRLHIHSPPRFRRKRRAQRRASGLDGL